MNRHRWKILGIGFAANASFSAVISGLPATAVLMRSAYGVDTAAVGAALGATGLGIALMPDYLALGLAGVRRVLSDSDGPMAECHLVYPEELRKSRRIADFRDFLLRELAAAKLA